MYYALNREMRKQILFFLIFLFGRLFFLPELSFAQDFENYTSVCSEGEIPDDFLGLTIDKYKKDVSELKYETRNSQKVKEEYLLLSNYNIDVLLRSGLVTYNDPLSDYVNKVDGEIKVTGSKPSEDALEFAKEFWGVVDGSLDKTSFVKSEFNIADEYKDLTYLVRDEDVEE